MGDEADYIDDAGQYYSDLDFSISEHNGWRNKNMATTKGGLISKAKGDNAAAAENAKAMKQLVLSMKSQIAKALPSVLTGERFSRMILTAMSTNPQLQQCSPKSFLGAMMQAAQLDTAKWQTKAWTTVAVLGGICIILLRLLYDLTK
jgi:hypothetical protein